MTTAKVLGKVGPVVPARCTCGNAIKVTVVGELVLRDYEAIRDAWNQLHRDLGHEPLWPEVAAAQI